MAMFSFGHWPSTNLGCNNVTIEFLLSRKLLSKFQNILKFSNMQLVCYVHLTGCSHWGGEGGFQGRGKKEKNEQKNNKMGKNFQCGIDLSPRPTRAGGPRVTPPREGSSARDKSTHSGPSWIVDESGRACSLRDGINIDNFVASFTRLYITKILAKNNQKIKIFFTCTGYSGSESNFYNFSKILILLFISLYKHGFK